MPSLAPIDLDDDLKTILLKYQSNQDLLTLILQSKVHEDARRLAEAQLRAKTLDYLILQKHHQLGSFSSQAITPPQISTPVQPDHKSLDSQLLFHQLASITPEPTPQDLSEPTFMIPDLPLTTIAAPVPPSTCLTSSARSASVRPIPPAPMYMVKTKRRREMQAISKVVETKEFPYADGYFWRNNGNTVQKKTGNKSVYYKCSNSAKGCPVNKTVTWREDGQYLIKYRGEHLSDCNRVQHIVDV
ncbi:hypothetical protein DM01DRAFT_1361736 [Hesseltinella vesiculosa]|uniref:WRKY domain-containing protein n=1 Tax=Hesseltinella vesiculosa TaxID=101127 RepID=A0A1X2GR69_9FUNG|nr:hypothetical protein DM01DRAFT_1361736 [Hesseltinella vesiculosa]